MSRDIRNCPETVVRTARWWPPDLPGGGHHTGWGSGAERHHSFPGEGLGQPPSRLAGWDALPGSPRQPSTEDDDLSPVLRGVLSDPGDLQLADAMVDEHRHIPPALDGVDAPRSAR